MPHLMPVEEYLSSGAALGPDNLSSETPVSYLIPADGLRLWPCQLKPLICLSVSLCLHTALLITDRPHFVSELKEGLQESCHL